MYRDLTSRVASRVPAGSVSRLCSLVTKWVVSDRRAAAPHGGGGGDPQYLLGGGSEGGDDGVIWLVDFAENIYSQVLGSQVSEKPWWVCQLTLVEPSV